MTSIYDISVPVMTKALQGQRQLLDKGAAWAKEKGIATSEIPLWRIHEDMLPLWAQVLFAVVVTQKSVNSLTGQDSPLPEVKETSFEGLYTVLDQTLEKLSKISSPKSITIEESGRVACALGPERQAMLTAADSLKYYTMPNVFFHVTTLYNILRMKGVPLGKGDYLLPLLHDVIGQ